MMCDEISSLESLINWRGDLVGLDSLQDHMGFEAFHLQFQEGRTATEYMYV